MHTPYFINFASANNRLNTALLKSGTEELERASLIGAKYLMTHLGSYKDLGEKEGFKQLVGALDKTLAGYKGETQFLIEMSAGSGAIIGDTFEEIAEVIHNSKLKNITLAFVMIPNMVLPAGMILEAKRPWRKLLKI